MMNRKGNEMNFTKISRELLESLTFRVFTKNDYYGFSGVMSPVPLIAEDEAEGICVVIDGDFAELYCYDGCANFECVDTCDNIRELQYKSNEQLKIEAEIATMEKALAELKKTLQN
jgi:hypothetical protein